MNKFSERTPEESKPTFFQHSTKSKFSKNKLAYSAQTHPSNRNGVPVQSEYTNKNRFGTGSTVRKFKDGEGTKSSTEKFHDSLDDQTACDSGLGSSSEYRTKVKMP